MFEIRKNLDLRKIFVTPKIFLKSGFHCTHWLRHLLRLVAFIKIHADCAETADYAGIGQWAKLDLQSIQHRDYFGHLSIYISVQSSGNFLMPLSVSRLSNREGQGLLFTAAVTPPCAPPPPRRLPIPCTKHDPMARS